MVGGEIPVGHAKFALKFHRVARSKQHHGLQPERRRLGGVSAGYLAERSSDFGRSVQHQPPAHACSCAGIDLVEQRGPEQIRAGDRSDEAVVARVEVALVVVGDLRPGVDADIAVVVGVALEAWQPWLIDDAGGVVDDQPVEEGAAVGRDRQPEPVLA